MRPFAGANVGTAFETYSWKTAASVISTGNHISRSFACHDFLPSFRRNILHRCHAYVDAVAEIFAHCLDNNVGIGSKGFAACTDHSPIHCPELSTPFGRNCIARGKSSRRKTGGCS